MSECWKSATLIFTSQLSCRMASPCFVKAGGILERCQHLEAEEKFCHFITEMCKCSSLVEETKKGIKDNSCSQEAWPNWCINVKCKFRIIYMFERYRIGIMEVQVRERFTTILQIAENFENNIIVIWNIYMYIYVTLVYIWL